MHVLYYFWHTVSPVEQSIVQKKHLSSVFVATGWTETWGQQSNTGWICFTLSLEHTILELPYLLVLKLKTFSIKGVKYLVKKNTKRQTLKINKNILKTQF